MTREAKTGTFTNLIGTYTDGVPAGGTGWEVKCLHTKGEDKKSCCASLLAKQTSRSEMSALGTIPTAEFRIAETILRAHRRWKGDKSRVARGGGGNTEWSSKLLKIYCTFHWEECRC